MPSLDVYSTSGKKTSTTSVKKKFFEAKINSSLMAQAIRVYLSNQRQAPAKTKSRGEVKVTKKKVWRQKGTGRARHGSRNAPIFVGGGKAHGQGDAAGCCIRACHGLQMTHPYKLGTIARTEMLIVRYPEDRIIYSQTIVCMGRNPGCGGAVIKGAVPVKIPLIFNNFAVRI